VLCLDEETRQILARLQLKHVNLIPLAELEQADPALRGVKAERLPLEYYWTCGPAFLVHLFQRDVRITMLTYLDADLFFFDDPAAIYAQLGAKSILIIEQRMPPEQKRSGRYNVGLLIFRRTEIALACLSRWRQQCLEWCFDRYESGRHGDQKYLDDWPERFRNVTVLQHLGAGVAPWNVAHQKIENEDGRVLVGGDPLIFYHFARLRRINRWMYEMHSSRFHATKVSPVVRRQIYGPYIRELQAAEKQIRENGGRMYSGTARVMTSGEVVRRGTTPRVGRLSLDQYQRFMLVAGPLVL
jgi:hypothetical protein